jgi:hypothetical protein
MDQKVTSRLWATFGVSVAAVVGLGLLLVFLSRGPGAPMPMATISIVPTPTDDDPTVASVNGRSIKRSFWTEAALLDQVMSGLTGQPAPAPDETLQRLINEELVLAAFPPERAATAAQVEGYIALLEQTWTVDDSSIIEALEQAGLTRAVFERTIERLLAIQAGLETLQSQGYETTAWLEEQRASAEVTINQGLDSMALAQAPAAQSQPQSRPQSPLATPTISPTPPPTVAPATLATTDPPLPAAPALGTPQVAPDFTLQRTNGSTFTLTEQLAQGPVVLVFFQKCG